MPNPVAILPLSLFKNYRKQDQRRIELEANPLVNQALEIDTKIELLLANQTLTAEEKKLA